MNKFLIEKSLTIRDAMQYLEDTGLKCLIIHDGKKLLGTLTDGDMRREILKGKKFSETIESCYNKNPIVINTNQASELDIQKFLIEKKIFAVPIIDKSNMILDVITLDTINEDGILISQKKIINIPVVIMAGGRGRRLKPFTDLLPKPLIPINDKTFIENIIDRFTSIGCNDFFLSVNHKKKIIKAYFEELNPSYNIRYIEEKKPLGTAGSLRLFDINESIGSVFVTNCDIIVKTSYYDIYQFHIENDYDLTLVASDKEFILPYGTCVLNENGLLESIEEKPKYEFLINTGLYIIKTSLLKNIPENKQYDITHLIEDSILKEKKIGVFPVNENSYFDTGDWAEYKKTLENL